MVTIRRLIDKRRWMSRRHFPFLVLLLGALGLFLYTNRNENESKLSPIEWTMNNSTKLFIQFVKQNIVSRITNESKAVEKQTVRLTRFAFGSLGPYLVEYPYEYHFLMNEPQRCEQEKPFVVLMVPVAPRNRAHRDVIRSTWGNEKLVLDKVVKLFFLLGMQTGHDAQQVHEQLLQESKEHRDLIQSDFMDCYKNLTIKTMVMLEWLNSYCSGASYAMKIDSDMFLNVPNLVKMLLNAPKTNYMTGLVVYDSVVLRNPSSKWYLPYELFSQSVYPPYALGLGYILSLDLSKKLIEASGHVKAVYIEDVYLGMCMKHLGIAPTNPLEGASFHVIPLKYDRCDFSNIIATTIEPYTDRVWLWNDFKRQTRLCSLVKIMTEFALFFNHFYILLLKIVNSFLPASLL